MEFNEVRELYLGKYLGNKVEYDKLFNEKIEAIRKGRIKIRLTDKNGKPVKNARVSIKQTNHDFNFGANIFMLDEFDNKADNEAYRRLFAETFNAATVPFYWDGLEPERNKPRYAADSPKVYRRPAPDLCIDYCKENNIRPKLHCLVYDKFTPDWLKKLPVNEVKAEYERRFKEISERYAKDLFEVEVINEVSFMRSWNGANDKRATDLIYEPDIVSWACRLARKYFPDNTLVINDAFNFYEHYQMPYYSYPYYHYRLQTMLNPELDKIGIQCHFFAGSMAKNPQEYDDHIGKDKGSLIFGNPDMFIDTFKQFSSLSKPTEVTEVTIPTFGEGEQYEELQAEMLRLWYSIWFATEGLDTVMYWNVPDGYAYVSKTAYSTWNENNCRGGLYHHDLTPKKSALMLQRLQNEIWHTECDTTTDENGCIELNGFYGDYTAHLDGKAVDFGLHKGTENISLEI